MSSYAIDLWLATDPKPPVFKPDFSLKLEEMIGLHKQDVMNYIEGVTQKKALAVLEESRQTLVDKIASKVKAGKGSTFTVNRYRAALAQVDAVLGEMTANQMRGFKHTSSALGESSVKDAILQVNAGEKIYTGLVRPVPFEEALRFQKTEVLKSSLLDQFDESITAYGHSTIVRIKKAMSQSMLAGEPMEAVIDQLSKTSRIFKEARWRAARIYRTELANTYEATRQSTAEWIKKELYPDLKKKLVAIHDDRTGADSIYVDGQTRDLNEPFEDNLGRKYQHPPNRPNDRETVLHVRDAWQD